MFQDFKELLSSFNAHSVKYLVVGGYAVSFHSQPRFTKDLALFIKADAVNATAVFAALASFGAALTGIAVDDLANTGKFFRFGKEPVAVDVLPGIEGVDFDAAWERRVEGIIDEQSGLKAFFISRPDLIASKLAVGRMRDLADVEEIRAAEASQSAALIGSVSAFLGRPARYIAQISSVLFLKHMSLVNPFQDPLRFERKMPECAMVIFGANGDLTKRKLIPALYRLAYEHRVAPGFTVLGISRTPMSDDQFREKMRESTAKFLENAAFDEDVWAGFAQSLFYMAGDVAEDACYTDLAKRLEELEKQRETGGNVLFYLSTQPSQYAPAALGIGKADLAKGNGWRRLVVEKPFGHDLASARQLSTELHEYFGESEVYRIDHYLGKETVQNILAFRFGNGIFEPLWNRNYIDHVQITAAESIGVEGRGAYYEEAGALRDMIQNHLLQVMATVAMEPSASFQPDSVRDERAKLLRSIRIMKPDEALCKTVAGQYGPARIGGKEVPGFRQEKGVNPESQTDTYAAITFFVDNWRWAGVPFYIRTGKRMPKRVSEIAIQFKSAPHAIFGENGSGPEHDANGEPPNLLILRIQPEEGISLKFSSKRPGAGMMLRPVSMDFNYGSSFGERSPSAYETLLLDAIIGDATLYTRQDMVEASWAVVEPILEAWSRTKFEFPNYAAGSWGPAAADEMLARRGHAWRKP